MTAKLDPRIAARPLPADVADVALIAADTCAAIGDVSVSWWHEEVRAERAPRPAIKKPRFTRWRLADVRQFWADRAAKADAQSGARMSELAKKASIKAREPAAVAKAQATRKARIAARQGATA